MPDDPVQLPATMPPIFDADYNARKVRVVREQLGILIEGMSNSNDMPMMARAVLPQAKMIAQSLDLDTCTSIEQFAVKLLEEIGWKVQ